MFGGRISGLELIIIIMVILLFFGARKLPGLARSLGRSAGELRKSIQEETASKDSDPSSEETADS